jgi:hypothetical protein
MSDGPLVDAVDLFSKARSAFDRGEFEEARKHARSFEALDYAFVRRIVGHSFEWRRNAVCIVAHRPLPSTRALLADLIALASDPDFCFVLVSNAAEDLFDYADEVLGGAFLGLVTGANFGASAGRNAVSCIAESENLIFLDDDGLTSPESIRKLVETRDRQDAAGVRGRIVAKSEFEGLPSHYDLGSSTRQWFINIEGMTIWATRVLRAERFDPLLYGHEGADVTSRLYSRYGPDAFLYEPAAIMRHDFAGSAASAADKRVRMDRNEAYLDAWNPASAPVRTMFRTLGYSINAAAALASRARLVEQARVSEAAPRISIVTLCDDDASSLDAYCKSVRPFLDDGAEIVLVCSGSSAATAQRVATLLGSVPAIRIIETRTEAPAAAFVEAVAALDTELALVAGLSQGSVPQRVEWARAALSIEPEADLVGFLSFDQETGPRSALPWPTWGEDMGGRCFFGAPCELGALAFRVGPLKQVAASRAGAVEGFGWLFDALVDGTLRGVMIPVAVSHVADAERRPASDLQFERDGRAHAVERHRGLLGTLGPYDQEALDYVVGAMRVPTDVSVGRLRSYAGRLVQRLAQDGGRQAATHANAVMRLVEENDLRRLRADALRLRARVKKVEQDAQELPKLQEELDRTRDKLEWNRDQVSELKEKLADLKGKIAEKTVEAARYEAQKLALDAQATRLAAAEAAAQASQKELRAQRERFDEVERRLRALDRRVNKPSLLHRVKSRLRGG